MIWYRKKAKWFSWPMKRILIKLLAIAFIIILGIILITHYPVLSVLFDCKLSIEMWDKIYCLNFEFLLLYSFFVPLLQHWLVLFWRVFLLFFLFFWMEYFNEFISWILQCAILVRIYSFPGICSVSSFYLASDICWRFFWRFFIPK